jgi:hypothetical protein
LVISELVAIVQGKGKVFTWPSEDHLITVHAQFSVKS